MQVKKQQLEPDMEQRTGSKLGKEYFKAVYCRLAYLTYIDWVNLVGLPSFSFNFWPQSTAGKMDPRLGIESEPPPQGRKHRLLFFFNFLFCIGI